MKLVRPAARRAAAWMVLATMTVAVLSGCAGPPPALPASVMAQGAEAVPEEHPELTDAQLAACGDCHLTSDAPTRP